MKFAFFQLLYDTIFMKLITVFILLATLKSLAMIDIGVGSSSVTGGRSAPAVALGLEYDSWGILARSVGVQTTIYAQNAWTVGAYKNIYNEKFGILGSSIGFGLGGSYIFRTFRESLTADIETSKEYALGPVLIAKFQLGPLYLGFDTVLGITKQIVQHLVLNFQDVSHVTIGVSF